MKRYLMISGVIGTLLTASSAKAQDIHFSQFYENAILRNPALTGIFSGDYKAGVNYRTQWSNISVPFQTVLASAETRIAVSKETGDYFSFGVTATYDKAGSINFNSMQVYPAINYNKALEDKHNSYLSFGFTAGYIQRSVDPTRMTFASQYQNGYNPDNASGENISNTVIQNYDLGAGVSLNSSMGEDNQVTYYLGAAAYHITQPKHTFAGQDAFIRLTMKWVGNLGVRYAITDQVAATIHANYSRQQPYEEIMAGGLVSWRSLNPQYKFFTVYGGLFIRYKDAIIPTIKIDYDRYSLTASYDYNTSSLNPATSGSGGYEFSLFVRGVYKKNNNNQTMCPRFEELLPTFY